jgi:iron(III) transport system substrate-binding protein
MITDKIIKAVSTLVFGVSFLLGTPVKDVKSQTSSQAEWERVVAGAKTEGQLVYHAGSTSEAFFREFQKKYPQIKATRMLTQGGSAAVQRLLSERRAGFYTADIVVIGGSSGFRLADAKVFDPVEPALILPEVTDRSRWWGGKHYYIDSENRYLFMFAALPQPDVGYNSKLVKPADAPSYWDLLNPRWKGKMVTLDPAEARGGASAGFRFLYYNSELGPNFIRRLLTEMDLTASRDERQIVDWLATGRFAISLFTSPGRTGLDKGRAQGLPVNWFQPNHFKEGVAVGGGGNNVALVNRAPHPNAAKLFLNWFLSREGQLAAQRVGARAGEGVDSLRIDVPKDDVAPEYRRQEGVKYLLVDRPEWMDMKPILQLIDESWGKRGK